MTLAAYQEILKPNQGRTEARNLLDDQFPLAEGLSHDNVKGYIVYYNHLLAIAHQGKCVGLVTPSQFKDFNGEENRPQNIMLSNSDLEVELNIDPSGIMGKTDKASIENISIKILVA